MRSRRGGGGKDKGEQKAVFFLFLFFVCLFVFLKAGLRGKANVALAGWILDRLPAAGELLLCSLVGEGGLDHDLAAYSPRNRGSDGVLCGQLERVEHADDLGNVTAGSGCAKIIGPGRGGEL